MTKQFLTYEQQIDLLHVRGLSTDENTLPALMRYGYYRIVNGYNAPFLDKPATAAAQDDRFLPGTSFADLYTLFTFDQQLTSLTLSHLARIEFTLRAVCAHTFAEAHPSLDSYLDPRNYSSRADERALNRLISTMASVARSSDHDMVAHYRDTHGVVPIWVLVGDLTFGNLARFLQLMRRRDAVRVCERISRVTSGTGPLSVDDACDAVDAFVRARNICAHGDRLYCAEFTRRCSSYAELVELLGHFLTPAEFEAFKRDAARLVRASADESEEVKRILSIMGFEVE